MRSTTQPGASEKEEAQKLAKQLQKQQNFDLVFSFLKLDEQKKEDMNIISHLKQGKQSEKPEKPEMPVMKWEI